MHGCHFSGDSVESFAELRKLVREIVEFQGGKRREKSTNLKHKRQEFLAKILKREFCEEIFREIGKLHLFHI